MFGCLVAGRLVSAARAAGAAFDLPGGPSTRRGPGVELPQGRPAGLAFALSWAPLGVGPGQRGSSPSSSRLPGGSAGSAGCCPSSPEAAAL